MNISELIMHHKQRCMKYVNSGCVTNRCILRGQPPGHFHPPFDSNLATCEEHETVVALQTAQSLLTRVKEACLDSEEPNKVIITVEPFRDRERELLEEICEFLERPSYG